MSDNGVASHHSTIFNFDSRHHHNMMSQPDIMANHHSFFPTYRKKLRVILPKSEKTSAVGKMMLRNPRIGGVIAGIDSHKSDDRTEITDFQGIQFIFAMEIAAADHKQMKTFCVFTNNRTIKR